MSLRTRVLAVWKDPVGSDLIADAIIAGVGYLYVRITAGVSQSSLLGSAGRRQRRSAVNGDAGLGRDFAGATDQLFPPSTTSRPTCAVSPRQPFISRANRHQNVTAAD